MIRCVAAAAASGGLAAARAAAPPAKGALFFFGGSGDEGQPGQAPGVAVGSFSRSAFFCTLPIALRGRSSTKTTRFGTLNVAISPLQRADDRALRSGRARLAHDHRRHRLAEVRSRACR